MREYKFKRGFKPDEDRLVDMLKRHFGGFEKDGKFYVVRFGAIEEMRVWIEKKKLYVDMRTNPRVSDEVATKTLKAYNRFLEELTGYTAKERARMMRKEVESG